MSDITTINPTTGEEISNYNYMSDDEINNIVDASHNAFLEWRTVSHEERGRIIKSIGDKLMEYKSAVSYIAKACKRLISVKLSVITLLKMASLL